MLSTQTQPKYCEDLSSEDRKKIDAQLERLLVHPLFRQSKRLTSFLRYVVQESLQDRSGNPPKERTLGITVFGREPDYDTATDPVVRVTATELRKKLAQYYYEEGHLDEIRIELPPGSYLPKFRKAPSPTEAEVAELEAALRLEPEPIATEAIPLPQAIQEQPAIEAAPQIWRRASFVLAALLAVALLGYIPLSGLFRHSPLDDFWAAFDGKASRVLIVMPVITHKNDVIDKPSDVSVAGNLSIEDTNIAARVAAQLEMRKSAYRLISAPELNFGDLRGVPAVLIGALDNVWTMRLDKTLPFAFEESPDGRTGRIVDTHDRSRSWSIDITTPHTNITKDYGIVARYRDEMTGSPVLVLAGISSQGTQAAGETVTNAEYLNTVLGKTIKPNTNFEVIVETEAIDGRSGPPKVVASRTW